VVDNWAFTAGMLTEFMSTEHTRATLLNLWMNIPWTAAGEVTFAARPASLAITSCYARSSIA